MTSERDPSVWPTPQQIVDMWEAADPSERLRMAERDLEARMHVSDCLTRPCCHE
jgi:hypothetical protein